jgi:hypothetical protein
VEEEPSDRLLFWVAPIVGALLAGWVSRALLDAEAEPEVTGKPV